MYEVEYDGTKNKVSILIASLREQELLKRLKEYDDINIQIPYEIVVVSPFKVEHPKVIWVEEKERKGNVYAMQEAFKNSTGNYIIFIADDVSPTSECIDNIFRAVRMRDKPYLGSFVMIDEEGKEQEPWYIQDRLYACYGCISRKHIEQIGGFFDIEYKHSWCDPDLALRVWFNEGVVEKCFTAKVINRQIHDDMYKQNSINYFDQDTETFLRKWYDKLGVDRHSFWSTFNRSYFTLEEHHKHIRMDKYLATPYKITDKPIVSFLMSCRVFNTSEFQLYTKPDMDRTDRFNLYCFFDSVLWAMNNNYTDQMEFLIKFDIDNELALQEYIWNNKLSEKYPQLIIRPFIFNRWEGRASLYQIYNYLFTKRNPSSKFIGFASDDGFWYQNQETNLNIMNILTTNKDVKYTIFASHHKEDLWQSIEHWKKDNFKWRDGWLTDPYPIITTDIIEIMGGFGFQNNIDSTFSLLTVMMWKKYGINLKKLIPNCFLRGNKKVETDHYETLFNDEFCISIDKVPEDDSYFWKLAEQQCDNIYLNMVKNE